MHIITCTIFCNFLQEYDLDHFYLVSCNTFCNALKIFFIGGNCLMSEFRLTTRLLPFSLLYVNKNNMYICRCLLHFLVENWMNLFRFLCDFHSLLVLPVDSAVHCSVELIKTGGWERTMSSQKKHTCGYVKLLEMKSRLDYTSNQKEDLIS